MLAVSYVQNRASLHFTQGFFRSVSEHLMLHACAAVCETAPIGLWIRKPRVFH